MWIIRNRYNSGEEELVLIKCKYKPYKSKSINGELSTVWSTPVALGYGDYVILKRNLFPKVKITDTEPTWIRFWSSEWASPDYPTKSKRWLEKFFEK